MVKQSRRQRPFLPRSINRFEISWTFCTRLTMCLATFVRQMSWLQRTMKSCSLTSTWWVNTESPHTTRLSYHDVSIHPMGRRCCRWLMYDVERPWPRDVEAACPRNESLKWIVLKNNLKLSLWTVGEIFLVINPDWQKNIPSDQGEARKFTAYLHSHLSPNEPASSLVCINLIQFSNLNDADIFGLFMIGSLTQTRIRFNL